MLNGNDYERDCPVSAVLKRFDYPRRNRRKRGILLKYLRHTTGYSRARMMRLIQSWQDNRLAL